MNGDNHGAAKPEETKNDSWPKVDPELLAEELLEERRQRMIKFLPNAITTASMFFGFIAIMMAMEKRFFYAVWAIVVAAICDMLDGRIARLTRSTSPFGVEYDSLSDLISFGFAPAMVAYFWALKDGFGRLGMAAAFIYIACTAIRLAKFNTLVGEEESRRYFRGIPSPAAAALIIMMVMIHISGHEEMYARGIFFSREGGMPLTLEPWVRGGMLIWVVAVALLMVSNIRFRTFKDVNLRKYGPVFPLVGLAAAIAVFMTHPYQTIFAGGMFYLILGLVEGGIILRRREREIRAEQRQLRKMRRLKRRLARKRAKMLRQSGSEKNEPPMRMVE